MSDTRTCASDAKMGAGDTINENKKEQMNKVNRDKTVCQIGYRIRIDDPQKYGYVIVPHSPRAHQDIPVPKPRKTREDTLLLTRLFNHFDIKDKSERGEITRRLFDRRWEKEAEVLAKKVCNEKGWRLVR